MEGESLAKQNGKQAEVIRKLRTKEKTTEAEVKKLKTETDRLSGTIFFSKWRLKAGLGIRIRSNPYNSADLTPLQNHSP